MANVFVSYVREDQPAVSRLVASLRAAGIDVWLDRDSIQPGQFWKDAIREGVKQGDFFIACFSTAFGRRQRTYMNEELTLAIEELRQRPLSASWFIPVVLSGCVPEISIGAGKTLGDIQYVRLDPAAWEIGVAGLIAAIIARSGAGDLSEQHQGLEFPAWEPTRVKVVKCRQHEEVFPLGSVWEQGQIVDDDLSSYRRLYNFRAARDIWERGNDAGALCIDRVGRSWFLRVVQIHRHGDEGDYEMLGEHLIFLGPYLWEYRLVAPDLDKEYLALAPDSGQSRHHHTYEPVSDQVVSNSSAPVVGDMSDMIARCPACNSLEVVLALGGEEAYCEDCGARFPA